MKFYSEVNVNYATDAFLRGKQGTCAVFRHQNGVLYFSGFGLDYRRVLKLWLKVGDQYYDEQTFDYFAIMRKSNVAKNRSAWFVMTQVDGKELANSENKNQEIRCIVVIDLLKKDVEDCADATIARVPFCLRAEFKSDCAAVAFIRDSEVCSMWLSEGDAIRAKENSDVPVEVVAVDKEVSQPVEGENTVSADNWGTQQEDYTLNGQPVRAIMV